MKISKNTNEQPIEGTHFLYFTAMGGKSRARVFTAAHAKLQGTDRKHDPSHPIPPHTDIAGTLILGRETQFKYRNNERSKQDFLSSNVEFCSADGRCPSSAGRGRSVGKGFMR